MATKQEIIEEIQQEIQKIGEWKHCMSYNDSYFGEPDGLVKRVAYQLERLSDALNKAP